MRRTFALVFVTSVVAGVAQIAILRELAAHHAIASLGLSIRLAIAMVLAAYGVGAALTPLIRGLSPRAFGLLGVAASVYLAALLFGLLRWLEPGLAAGALTPARLVALGCIAAPPFVAYGLLIARLMSLVQRDAPGLVGALLGVSLLGSAVGIFASHQGAASIGVNSLLLAAAVATPPLFTARPVAALALGVAVCLAPIDGRIELVRASRPAFHPPVTEENTTHLFSGWSAHQKIDLYRFREDVLLGFYNGFWQWWVSPQLDHAHAFPGYGLLYQRDWVEDRDVLVIGSGAGMGLLHLERSAPRSITAVEMDPLVVELARGRFAADAGHIYDRVPVHVIEGRAFLDATPDRYDLVLYEGSFLTAAHPTVAVSAENHLYTKEGIDAALAALEPGGIGIVMFAGPEHALRRVVGSVLANGAAVQRLALRHPGTLWWDLPVLVFGREADRVRAVARGVVAAADSREHARLVPTNAEEAPPLVDARPFLYAEGPAASRPLAVAVAAVVALFAATLLPAGDRRLRLYYFAIGAGFMFVQYAVLARFRSFFGDPVSTAFGVVLLLMAGMAIGSAASGLAWRRLGSPILVIGASSAILLVALVAALPDDLALSPVSLRASIAAGLLVPSGAMLGLFFPLGLRGRGDASVPPAFAFDALGGVAGFLGFHAVALAAGIPASLAVGLVAYGCAVLLLARS